MKVLLTGGAGYIGSHTLKKLRDHGHSVLVYDDLSSGHTQHMEGAPLMRADICDANALDAAMRDFRPDTVFHIAALATMSECTRRPDDCHRINVDGTRNILEAMRQHQVGRIVFASSCAVYANAATLTPLRETDAAGPISPYAKSKHDCEILLQAYAQDHGIRHVAFRIFNASGAHPDGLIGECHDPETHLLPLVIDRMLGRRSELAIFGDDYPTPDGTAIRDYVHVWDIAEAFLRAGLLLEQSPDSHILNLGSGAPASVYDLIREVKAIAAMDIPYVIKPRREGDSAWLFANNDRLAATLGWRPACSNLPDIIRTALQWHQRQNPPS